MSEKSLSPVPRPPLVTSSSVLVRRYGCCMLTGIITAEKSSKRALNIENLGNSAKPWRNQEFMDITSKKLGKIGRPVNFWKKENSGTISSQTHVKTRIFQVRSGKVLLEMRCKVAGVFRMLTGLIITGFHKFSSKFYSSFDTFRQVFLGFREFWSRCSACTL